MRLATVHHRGERRWGVVQGDRIRLAPSDQAPGPDLAGVVESGTAPTVAAHWAEMPLADVALQAPIPVPRRNIVCLGLNYADHAAEAQGTSIDRVALPEDPIVFTKATTTVCGPDAAVVLDERVTTRLDWEVELAVVIARGGRFIPAQDAMAHVFGYTVVNDLSARDLQKRHRQFFLGKSLDGSCPMGPWLVTADAVADPHGLDIACRVNGVVKQHSNTRHLIFSIPAIIERLSRVMTLQAGDIIATGTPGGVGFARTPREYLQPGDVVECEIEGLGALRTRIVGPAA